MLGRLAPHALGRLEVRQRIGHWLHHLAHVHSVACVYDVLAGHGLALGLQRLVVGLAHDEADELGGCLLHQRLGVVGDLRVP
eukprot:scaffold62214_cov71-Phaeocystis_antarctica.AAC.7